MISKRYPHCITEFMARRVLVDADYHLNAVGQAIAWVRIAAEELRRVKGSEKADYNAYAGVSASRTAIDSMASWVNLWSGVNRAPSAGIDLGNPKFRRAVDARVSSDMAAALDQLNHIGVDQVDKHRQRAQHREG